MRKLSWKARRRGRIYCAPACGAGCLYAQYQEQVQLGKKMRLSMYNPKQWRASVRENLHWYVCLEHVPTNGFLTVWVYGARYAALLSLDMSHAGDMDWSDHRSFRTPQAAVNHIVTLANTVMAKKNAVLERLQPVLKP